MSNSTTSSVRIDLRLPLFNGKLEDSDDEEQDFNENDVELNEFTHEEASHIAVFGQKLRISCVPHSLQCTLREVLEKDPEFLAVKSNVLSLITSINKSSLASSKLALEAKLSLVKPALTRWNYIFYVFDRMLAVRKPITDVLNELGWDNLSNSEWRKVRVNNFT